MNQTWPIARGEAGQYRVYTLSGISGVVVAAIDTRHEGSFPRRSSLVHVQRSSLLNAPTGTDELFADLGKVHGRRHVACGGPYPRQMVTGGRRMHADDPRTVPSITSRPYILLAGGGTGRSNKHHKHDGAHRSHRMDQ